MDTARCPACSAVVRTDADWCSLCYQDLRPPPAMMSAAAAATTEPSAAPVPNPAISRAVAAAVEAPVSGQAKELTEPDTPNSAGWPCVCGNQVGFDQDDCPACGSPFLGDLRDENDGRHRAGGPFGARWNESRVFRFIFAGGVALLIAVVVPVLLTLLG